ncbi:MAG: GntR family transcriptional regulator [Chitinivibrionales bacterium]|nr:GntR family transcriptional regulator [Chitinivibrionales bacterium]
MAENIKIPPGVQKGADYLMEAISDGRIREGQCLASIPELAGQAGISSVTMWKALGFLRKQGIVDGMRGKPFTVAPRALRKVVDCSPKTTVPDGDNSPSYLWQRVRNRLAKDILSGVYSSADTLPSVKEMQLIYRTTFRPLKKALDALCREGMILPHKKTYAPVSLTSHRANAGIRVILLSDQEKKLWPGSLNEECIRILETECVAANVELQVIGYTETGKFFFARSDEELKPISSLKDSDAILGYLYLIILDDEWRDAILRRLVSFNKPVALLDVVGGWDLSTRSQNNYVKHFSAATSSLPGRIAARYFLETGHRTVAYISPFHRARWSQNRWDGIRETFAAAGHEHAVTPFVWNKPPEVHSVYHDDALKNCPIDKLVNFFNTWKKSVPHFYVKRMDSYFNFQLGWRILTVAEFYRQLHKLFDSALGHENISAWIVANDDVALAALEYLQMNKIDVPGKISLLSFDDTRESLRQGITSYNFNMRAVVRTMLDYVLNTRTAKRKSTYQPSEIDGVIIERMTTARLRIRG